MTRGGVRCGGPGRYAGVLWCLALVAFAGIAIGSGYRCDGVAVSIATDAETDPALVCGGARDALSFFARLNLVPSAPISVEVRPDLPHTVGHAAAGCYLGPDSPAMVVPFDDFKRHGTWFGVSIGADLYRSLVAHEVAHAIADCHFADPGAPIGAKEYVAYVAMFATMRPSLRARILAANDDRGFDSEMKINTTIYLCDPMRFAVRSYRHYLRDGNGDEFLLRVLSGQALAD